MREEDEKEHYNHARTTKVAKLVHYEGGIPHVEVVNRAARGARRPTQDEIKEPEDMPLDDCMLNWGEDWFILLIFSCFVLVLLKEHFRIFSFYSFLAVSGTRKRAWGK